MELAYSDAPEEWQEAYVNRIASLKSFGAYIRESMVFSTYITEEVEELQQKNEILENMEKYKNEYIQFKQLAESAKP